MREVRSSQARPGGGCRRGPLSVLGIAAMLLLSSCGGSDIGEADTDRGTPTAQETVAQESTTSTRASTTTTAVPTTTTAVPTTTTSTTAVPTTSEVLPDVANEQRAADPRLTTIVELPEELKGESSRPTIAVTGTLAITPDCVILELPPESSRPSPATLVWFEDTVSLNAEGTELTFTWHRFKPHILRSGDTLSVAGSIQHEPLEAWTFRTPPGPHCPRHLIYVISGIWEPSLTRDPDWRNR